MKVQLHVGLIVNPLAGMGGSLGLKGSDGQQVRELVLTGEAQGSFRALERTARTLDALLEHADLFRFSCWGELMGARSLDDATIPCTVLGNPELTLSDAQDTRVAATSLRDAGVDIILFAGGDGTARDILDAVGSSVPTLGIPTGVKMHSGVFTVSPEAAADLLVQLAEGGLVGLRAQEVRDIDEEAFRQDIVRSRFYGELMVPGEGRFLQHTKVGGREDPELAAADIAAWIVEHMEEGRTYFIGPGSTTAAIMAELDLPNTLLGVDVICSGEWLAADVNEKKILALLSEARGPATIVVTAIGGQGYIFGRGNQQISAAVIQRIGIDNLLVVAAKSKLAGLEGRPLLVDTNDAQLDLSLCGYRAVVTGYDDQTLYRVSNR